jgi:methyl-accepting chemotaxis protein-1 (serine sensor receptor)
MFKNLSIRVILTSALALFFFVFLALSLGSYKLLDSNRQAMGLMLENNVVRGDLARQIASELLRARLALMISMNLLKDGEKAKAAATAQRIAPYSKNADAMMVRLKATPDLSTEGAPLFAQLLNTYRTYREQAYDPVVAAALAGDLPGAQRINDEKVTPLGTEFTKAINTYADYTATVGAAIANETSQRITQAIVVQVVVGLVMLALIVGLFVLFTRSVFHPLRQAGQMFDSIAAGDLTHRIDNRSNNEIGLLFAALKRMQDSLSRTVSTVRLGVGEIHSGAREISAGNLDLSSRTEEQAASLEETAASMEELASTVRQNADNSRQASQMAMDASEVARLGGDAVGKVVTTMREISDSSRRMSEIVGVIDGIAFQTNILALNAAVEAARAGEQGKGFAVVASEVRSLAQRSGQAAKEIKGLIDDSVHKVSLGSNQVESAGATMQEIVNSVRRVSDIVGEISAASEEQSGGIQQVNQAVTQMDAATQQNAALVEESAASATALEDQASRLQEAVAVFKLSSGQVIDAPAAALSHHAARPRLATQGA